jgi:TatA/E family protein of Tat protein translocase
MNALLFLETVGTSELLLVAVAALLLFGPRKLPEISRTLGKAMAEFKRASDDFKRTWEYEVELERRKPALDAAEEPRRAEGESSEQTPAANAPGASAWGATASGVTAEESMSRAVRSQDEGRTVARNAPGAEAWTGGGANENGAGETEQDEIELNAS